jgi:carotenoid cleavage dioxygenase-like enzyme
METGQLGGAFGNAGGAKMGGVNPNVNISEIAGRLVAMTEGPQFVEFDPHTLHTFGILDHEDGLPGHMTTAHPLLDLTHRQLINFNTEFGPRSQYHFYSIAPGQKQRVKIASVETAAPSYMHSFAMTENHVILTEFPLVVNLPKLMHVMQTGTGSFLDSLEWQPERGTRFTVVRKSDGALINRYESEAFFAFHQVNAFERGGEIFLDLPASSDASTMSEMYVDKLKTHREKRVVDQLRRYRLGAGSHAEMEVLSHKKFEFPALNFASNGGREYRYTYGSSIDHTRNESFHNQLVKVDVQEGQTQVWSEPQCYPGEPIFVPAPDAKQEDDGVNLSVVLDGAREHSFLLILDAVTFTEIGRADVPHHIPFGFHGIYTENFKGGARS